MMRNNQTPVWRNLTNAEISLLIQQNNSADDWTQISVVCAFSVDHIRNCHFSGPVFLEEDLVLENIRNIRRYRISAHCRIRNVGDLDFSKERFAYPMELCNEDGQQQVEAVPGMNSTDVFCALARHCPTLFSQHAETLITGTIGEHATIENVAIVRNACIGPFAEISGCSRIEQTWVDSSREEPSQLGSGLILRRSIVHKGARLDTNAILTHVLVGQQVSISDGARVYHSAVGDNSHIAGCEIGHAFLYPCHEQHHSNSFLIAAHIQGQSNVAAGATLGSNHNGRKNDVDLIAGRGFWPGLCTSLAFPCRFAPFTLIAKGDYPRPLNIPFAFALVNNNIHENCLEVMPAYWWMHNAYALMRNKWKYQHRDKRIEYTQYYDFQPIAPDTIQVVMENHRLLTRHLAGETELPPMEMSGRPVKILKENDAVTAYREMMLCFALAEGVFDNSPEDLLDSSYNTDIQWINAGGNILNTEQWQQICNSSSLKELHQLQLDFVDENLSFVHKRYAVSVLRYLCDGDVTVSRILALCREAIEAQVRFYERVIEERKKDLSSEFRTTGTPYPSLPPTDVFNDPICQLAAEEIAQLERKLHY